MENHKKSKTIFPKTSHKSQSHSMKAAVQTNQKSKSRRQIQKQNMSKHRNQSLLRCSDREKEKPFFFLLAMLYGEPDWVGDWAG